MGNKKENRPVETGGLEWDSGQSYSTPISYHNSQPTASVKIYAAGRVVGIVDGEVFYKTVSASKHFLHTPRAIALDTQSLVDARDAGAFFVEIHDRESGEVYNATIEAIWKRGFTLDRGYGRQIALPIELWQKGAWPAAQLALDLGV